MKKIIGIICLTLAALSGVRLIIALSNGSFSSGASGRSAPYGHTAAYESGRFFGMISAPLLFAALGLWLLRDDSMRPARARPAPASGRVSGGVPVWVKAGLGAFVGVIVAWCALSLALKYLLRPSRPRPPAAIPSPTWSNAKPNWSGYKIGDRVEIQWAGRWLSGTVRDFNGPMVQVGLDNAGPGLPPQPWLGTNQVRRP